MPCCGFTPESISEILAELRGKKAIPWRIGGVERKGFGTSRYYPHDGLGARALLLNICQKHAQSRQFGPALLAVHECPRVERYRETSKHKDGSKVGRSIIGVSSRPVEQQIFSSKGLYNVLHILRSRGVVLDDCLLPFRPHSLR